MKREWGQIVTDIEAAIRECGPMTKAELGLHLGLGRDVISSVVARMGRATKLRPKRLFVSGYVYDMEGQRRYPRAIYDLGDEPDAQKPNARSKAHLREIKRRYYEKRRTIAQRSSVFHLGRTLRSVFDKEAA